MFIDFKVDCNLVGTKRSCIQDLFAMVGNIYGHNIKNELYKDFPPHKYKDTLFFSVLQIRAVKTHFRFYYVTDYFKMNGQMLKFVLLNGMNSGVYIATSEIYFLLNNKEYENHAFVYNSYFTQEEYPTIHGGIKDNKINSNYHVLEKKRRLTNSAFTTI